jgi:hypothetical protein
MQTKPWLAQHCSSVVHGWPAHWQQDLAPLGESSDMQATLGSQQGSAPHPKSLFGMHCPSPPPPDVALLPPPPVDPVVLPELVPPMPVDVVALLLELVLPELVDDVVPPAPDAPEPVDVGLELHAPR